MICRTLKKPLGGPLRAYLPDELEQCLSAGHAAFEVISFDVFDTLVCRDVETPEVVLERICEATLPTLSPLGWEGDERGLLKLRRDIETRQRLEAESRGFDQETRLDEILPELYEACGGGPGATSENRRWVRESLEREIEYETAVLAPVPAMHRLFHRLQDVGKRLVLTSDMYLSEAAIRRLLEARGFDLSGVRVYVSSESLLNKGTGRLFRHWMDLCGVEPFQAAHVGDNHWSDVTAPDRLGITSFWLHEPERSGPLPLTRRHRFIRNAALRWRRELSKTAAHFGRLFRLSGQDASGRDCSTSADYSADSNAVESVGGPT